MSEFFRFLYPATQKVGGVLCYTLRTVQASICQRFVSGLYLQYVLTDFLQTLHRVWGIMQCLRWLYYRILFSWCNFQHENMEMKMKDFDESLMDTCRILKDITPYQSNCLNALVKSEPLITWLKESMKKGGETKMLRSCWTLLKYSVIKIFEMWKTS